MKREPETKCAWLPSKAFGFRRATKHFFVFAENVIIPPPPGSKEKPTNGVAFVYRCEESGTLRRWGFEAPARQWFR